MIAAFLVLAARVSHAAKGDRRLFGTIGLSLAVISFTVITVDYFVQLQTVQPALLRAEEAESVVVLSQYNPHGVFIALENLGFLAMAVSFAFLALTLVVSGVMLAIVFRRSRPGATRAAVTTPYEVLGNLIAVW